MKKSPKGRGIVEYQKRRHNRLERRRIYRQSRKKIHTIQKTVPPKQKKDKRRFHKIVELPEDFNLTENYNESIKAINQVRAIHENKQKKWKYYIDFDNIKTIGPAAALILASEFEVARLRSNVNFKWRVDDNRWNPEIQALLVDMGFHKLLDLNSKVKIKNRINTDLRFLEFWSKPVMEGNFGQIISEIINKICHKVADEAFSLELLEYLVMAITEAVHNASRHAYPDNKKAQTLPISRWWISSSIQKSNNEIKVICYDRGASIPKTIPNFIEKLTKPFPIIGKSDSELIKLGLTTDKSQINEEGRGNGLPTLKEFIDESGEGRLIIMSRKGRVTYSKSRECEPDWELENLPIEIRGTLVVWSIILKRR